MRSVWRINSIRALSPVIAVLLMIAITVVASLVAFAWVSGYLSFTTTKTGKAMQIQSIANSTSSNGQEMGNLTVYVQNTGEGSIHLGPDSVYVDGSLQSIVSINGVSSSFPSLVEQGETKTVTVNFPITKSGSHVVKVVSNEGTFSETTQMLTANNHSPSSSPPQITNGIISITFDDGLRSEFDNAFPILEEYNVGATFYVITDKIRDISHDDSYMSANELRILQSHGNEIGSHSKTHDSFSHMSSDQVDEECRLSKQTLNSFGLTVNNFAFPYGDATEHMDTVSLYYRSARTAYEGPYLLSYSSPQFELTGYPGESNCELQNQIDQVAASNSWTILFFHDVVTEYSDPPNPYSIDSQGFSDFIEYALSKGVQILTVNQVLDLAH